ncbi:metallophosphoesterase [Candidatus Micrarchaeota archaeon]|nr:metallophosphoesterase [Candidatus Micrarchaeota archaeon]
MKILAVADVHGEERVVDRLRVLASKNNYDAVFLVGDLTVGGSISFVEDLLEFLPNLFAVHGNMDSFKVLELLESRGVSVHSRSRKLNDYSVVGFGGSNPTPFNTPVEYSDEEIRAGLSKLPVDSNTIALFHAPPFGFFDEVASGVHVGSRAVRDFIEAKQPLLSIHAHIHEQEGEAQLGRTKLIKLGAGNAGRVAEIFLDAKGVKTSFLRL